MKKILLIHNVINPTRTQFFNEMNNYLKGLGYDFKVIFNAKTESNRAWNLDEEIKRQEFEYTILESKQIHIKLKNDNYYFHINNNLKEILNKENPDIIIHAGRASFSARQSQKWCKKNKKKFVLWNESSKYEKSRRRAITKPLVKYLVKKSDNYISFGTRATEYLEILGAKKERVCQIYNTVDIDFFTKEAEWLTPQKENLKQKYGIKTKNVILFVGQLIERKGIYEILEGFKKFQNNNSDWSLVFVGGGQEKDKMERIIKEQSIKNVFFLGFFQKDKISELYTIADIFTLPSIEEVRGLVINEAMCFGLPIITAYKVGASTDLVKEGKNGYIMKENTPEEFEKGLEFILSNNLIVQNESCKIIDSFRIDKFVDNIGCFL